jgi:hypothetical protein
MKRIMKVLVLGGYNIAPHIALHALHNFDPKNRYFDAFVGGGPTALPAISLASGSDYVTTMNHVNAASHVLNKSNPWVWGLIRTLIMAPHYNEGELYSFLNERFRDSFQDMPKYLMIPLQSGSNRSVTNELLTNLPSIDGISDLTPPEAIIASLSDGIHFASRKNCGYFHHPYFSSHLHLHTIHAVREYFENNLDGYDGYAVFHSDEPMVPGYVYHGTPFNYWDGSAWPVRPSDTMVLNGYLDILERSAVVDYVNTEHCLVGMRYSVYGNWTKKAVQRKYLYPKTKFIDKALPGFEKALIEFSKAVDEESVR